MTFFYLQIHSLNYLYPVNSILWKIRLIDKIFLQILFGIKKHIVCCKLFLANCLFRNFEVKSIFLTSKRNDTIRIFFFILRSHLLRWIHFAIAFSIAEIIYYYKLLIKMIQSTSDLMIYLYILVKEWLIISLLIKILSLKHCSFVFSSILIARELVDWPLLHWFRRSLNII